MHVCFVTRLTEHLGIQLLVALLDRAGHRVDHVFDPGLESAGLFPADWNPGLLNTDEQTIQMILDTGSDMVGFNLEINTFAWSVEIAQKLKARNPDLMIIVGGVHATTVPHVVMEFECFDYLCMGEGDVAFLELLDALDKNADTTAIGNIHARLPSGEVAKNAVRPLLKDLDDLPFFDKSIHYDLAPEFSREYHTNTSRGCVYSCSFCFYQPIQKVYGSRFRNMRSVDSVCEEMAAAVKAWPSIKTVTFHDEVFTANSRWLAEFADKWPTEVGLPFSIITHPELVKEETAVLLGRAGCAHVIMGTQTVNDQSRDMLARTETSEDVRRAVTSLRAQGIWTVVDHILGIPGEVDQDQDDALLFYSSIKPNVIKAFFLTYLPGTDINKQGLESGMWDLERLRAAERGHIDSWLFKGVGDIPEWRAYYQLFTLFTVVPPDLMHWAVEKKLHRVMKVLDPVFLPSLFLLPRVAQSLLGGEEEQPRSYVNYLQGLFRYWTKHRFPDQPQLHKAARTLLRPNKEMRSWHAGTGSPAW